MDRSYTSHMASEFALSLSPSALEPLRTGGVVTVSDPALFRIEGAGAVACLQGLLTNDVETPGPGCLVYGAILTPKGMIVVDCWVLRDADGLTLTVPRRARLTALELFAKRLPPRLTKVTDLTDEWTAAWVAGPEAVALVTGLLARNPGGGQTPEPGRAMEVPGEATADGRLYLGITHPSAPWRALAIGNAPRVREFADSVIAAGATAGGERDLEAARILAGWPALGAEISDKTLPQEVRYDDIGGVSYTKGCYVGQETVARVHFRGHPNRELRGLVWTSSAPIEEGRILREDKEVGRVTSVLSLATRHLALATIRREVAVGDVVRVDDRPARVVMVPFALDDVEA